MRLTEQNIKRLRSGNWSQLAPQSRHVANEANPESKERFFDQAIRSQAYDCDATKESKRRETGLKEIVMVQPHSFKKIINWNTEGPMPQID